MPQPCLHVGSAAVARQLQRLLLAIQPGQLRCGGLRILPVSVAPIESLQCAFRCTTGCNEIVARHISIWQEY